MNKKRQKDAEYANESVPYDSKNFKNIGALCTFYKYKMSDGTLMLDLSEHSPFYVPLSQFLLKLPSPSRTDNELLMYDASVSPSILNTINDHSNLM